ncbi:MAG: sialate O-acetylesterase [Spirosomataceae bacterium]
MRTLYCILVAFLAYFSAIGQSLPNVPAGKFHLYLLAGQSNMAGRGKLDSLSTQTNPRVWMLNKANQWVLAKDPIHFDKPVAGVSLGFTFGKIMAEADTSVYIGLIPCAVGGSSIEAWNPDSIHRQTMVYPWNDAIKRTQVALQTGTLKGILWHQGETDSKSEKVPLYEARLMDLVNRFRKAFSSPSLPFVAGTLPDFFTTWNPEAVSINTIINRLPSKIPHTKVVNTAPLSCLDDKTHFDTPSLRKLGVEYAKAMQELLKH